MLNFRSVRFFFSYQIPDRTRAVHILRHVLKKKKKKKRNTKQNTSTTVLNDCKC